MIKKLRILTLQTWFITSLNFSSSTDDLLCQPGRCPIFGSMQIADSNAATVEYAEHVVKNESCCVRLDYEFRTMPVLALPSLAIAILFLNRRAVFSCTAPGTCRTSVPDLPHGFYELRVLVILAENLEDSYQLAEAAFECSERPMRPGEEGCGVLTMLSQKMNFFEVSRRPAGSIRFTRHL
jgi:hypothetical protein